MGRRFGCGFAFGFGFGWEMGMGIEYRIQYSGECTLRLCLWLLVVQVADCVCLFGLRYACAVPLDTHMLQVLARDYRHLSTASAARTATATTATTSSSTSMPTSTTSTAAPTSASANRRARASRPKAHRQRGGGGGGGTSLTHSAYRELGASLRERWGVAAGWAQAVRLRVRVRVRCTLHT